MYKIPLEHNLAAYEAIVLTQVSVSHADVANNRNELNFRL